VNKGGILNTDICPTISCSSWENNCLLIEIEEKENIPKDEERKENASTENH
jgi:hypothetical protein